MSYLENISSKRQQLLLSSMYFKQIRKTKGIQEREDISESRGCWPQMAEMHVKGVTSVNPDP